MYLCCRGVNGDSFMCGSTPCILNGDLKECDLKVRLGLFEFFHRLEA